MSDILPTVSACVRIERTHRHMFAATDLIRTASEYAEGDQDMARLLQRINLQMTAMYDQLAMAEHDLHRMMAPEDLIEARERLNS
jgi:hypothetical protein